MPIPDPDKIRSKLEQEDIEEVRNKLLMGAYAKYKIPTVKEYLRQKEKEQNTPTYMYHEVKAPEGIIFPASEVLKLERTGWVDTPAKFGKGFRARTRRVINVLSQFWINHWKWIIGSLIALLAILVQYITVKK